VLRSSVVSGVDPQVVQIFGIKEFFDTDDQLGVILPARQVAAQAQIGDGLRG
jgi:hypothetical protein